MVKHALNIIFVFCITSSLFVFADNVKVFGEPLYSINDGPEIFGENIEGGKDLSLQPGDEICVTDGGEDDYILLIFGDHTPRISPGDDCFKLNEEKNALLNLFDAFYAVLVPTSLQTDGRGSVRNTLNDSGPSLNFSILLPKYSHLDTASFWIQVPSPDSYFVEFFNDNQNISIEAVEYKSGSVRFDLDLELLGFAEELYVVNSNGYRCFIKLNRSYEFNSDSIVEESKQTFDLLVDTKDPMVLLMAYSFVTTMESELALEYFQISEALQSLMQENYKCE